MTGPGNWIYDRTVGFVFDKVGDATVWVAGSAVKGVGAVLHQFEGVFVIIAMIGTLFIMGGNKKIGTRMTSFSFITYLICKAVFKW